MYTLPFILRQHTPLIHFQHEQEGATLRASEVKPKLDKFLNRVCEGKEIQILERNTTNAKSLSLNYQLKINAAAVNISDIPDKFPCFFANMGDDAAIKKFCFTAEPINCTIISVSGELIALIKGKLADFFSCTNFGMRQTKGFGSFYIEKNHALYQVPSFYYSFFDVSLQSERTPVEKHRKIFSQIELLYKSMRGGINETSYRRNGIYMKPIIWQYYKNLGVNWEKRKIKREFAAPRLTRQTDHYANSFESKNNPVTFDADNYRLIKDLFGLATDETAWEREYGFTIKKSHPVIERFMSPVRFKPIMIDNNECRVYLDAQEIPAAMFNQQTPFTISNNQNRAFSINTPEQVFDFYHFFDFMLDEILLEDVITNYDERNATVSQLNKIYSQLSNHR